MTDSYPPEPKFVEGVIYCEVCEKDYVPTGTEECPFCYIESGVNNLHITTERLLND
jgi:hypothetical protein